MGFLNCLPYFRSVDGCDISSRGIRSSMIHLRQFAIRGSQSCGLWCELTRVLMTAPSCPGNRSLGPQIQHQIESIGILRLVFFDIRYSVFFWEFLEYTWTIYYFSETLWFLTFTSKTNLLTKLVRSAVKNARPTITRRRPTGEPGFWYSDLSGLLECSSRNTTSSANFHEPLSLRSSSFATTRTMASFLGNLFGSTTPVATPEPSPDSGMSQTIQLSR